jgi:hypothetical protein
MQMQGDAKVPSVLSWAQTFRFPPAKTVVAKGPLFGVSAAHFLLGFPLTVLKPCPDLPVLEGKIGRGERI